MEDPKETPSLAPGCIIKSFPRTASEMSSEMRALERQTFEIAFESALGEMSSGSTLETFCREYHVTLQPGRFRAWIYASEKRKRAYEVSEALWADAVADELLRISDGINPDGSPSVNDTNMRNQQINVRKWLMAAKHRAKYGDVKKVEQTTTTTVDISAMNTDDLKRYVMEQLQQSVDAGGDGMGFLEGEFGTDD